MKTFKATGGYGDLFCDPETGSVEYSRRRLEEGGRWLRRHHPLDVDEWRKFWPGGDLFAGRDILDFGTWAIDGSYCGPEMDWRESLLEDRPELQKERVA
jgi:hypothetical protein